MSLSLRQTIGSPLVPPEYNIWQLCKTLHVLPDELDRLPTATIEMYMGFMNAEGKAAKIAEKRASSS